MSNNKKVAIKVNDIHKEFILPQSKNSTFKQTVVNIVKNNKKVTQKVLDGVSFEINKGDFFGVVGRNGSGKSTLLKLIAGVYYPTAGNIEVNGGLTPFIELGVGFNPELSGRDNVFLNGALLGYNRTQMGEMYDEIVEFAELEQFMDQKLKNYSSGMQVRLAFSIAIKAKNEILIFDEVLAVGDEAFQRKCLDVFEQYKANGQTVVLVTHDMETIRDFCTRAVLIHEGKLVVEGDPREVAQAYSDLNQNAIDRYTNNATIRDEAGISVNILNAANKEVSSFSLNDTLRVECSWKNPQSVESIVVNIYKKSGEHITGYRSSTGGHSLNQRRKKTTLDVVLNIHPGRYYLLIQAIDKDNITTETIMHGPEFTITDGPMPWSGLTGLESTWG